MFNYLLYKDETSLFLKTLFNNSVYYDKKDSNKDDIIGLFYDALFRYSVLLDSEDYYNEFLSDLRVIFKKINTISEIDEGINKLLSRLILKKLNTKNKSTFIEYVYDRFINNGYFIHAYSNKYKNDIDKNGLIIDEYDNLYDDFIKVQEILNKYSSSIIDKDFTDKSIYFTDSMRLAYYYASRSPYYFYNLICGEKFIKNKLAYSNKNYKECLGNVKKLCYKYSLTSDDEKYVLDTFNKEWELLDNENNINSFILVKRNTLEYNKIPLEEFINKYSSESYDFILDRLIDSNYSNIKCNKNIDRENITFIDVNNKFEGKEEKKVREEKEYFDEFDFSNSYGKVSLLLLLGAILITIGIIITVVLVV